MGSGVQKSLSKSRVLRGFQCAKNLYLHLNRPDLEPKVGPDQQAIFDQGNEVGAEARKRFPGGTLIDAKPWETREALARTRAAIETGARTIFEAAFEHEGITARIDVLHREGPEAGWKLIEVKSTLSRKDEHALDLAIQAWVLRGAGLGTAGFELMHLNPACAYPRLEELFTRVDLTSEVEALLPAIPERLSRIREALAQARVPDVDIGPHCDTPHECPFQGHCFAERGVPSPSVFELPSIGKKAWELYREGVLKLDDPRLREPGRELTDPQARMIESTVSGKRLVDREKIAEELESWQWPLHYLDFETINPAIPRYDGTHPYEQVPFQFSLHYQQEPSGQMLHFSYLHPDGSDPRRKLAEALVKAVASRGSVVSYYKKFEDACLEKLAGAFPDLAPALQSMRERLVDPLPVFRAAVYDPGFLGSFSIKRVAPSILGRERVSYDGMAVGDGLQAQRAFAEMARPGTPAARRAALREGLLEYCKQDTLAMVLLVEWLLRESQGHDEALSPAT